MADFYGIEIRSERVVPPILAVDDSCHRCDAIDKEIASACHMAIIMPGCVEVVYCNGESDGMCQVAYMKVGDVREDGVFEVSKSFANIQAALLRFKEVAATEDDRDLIKAAENWGSGLTEAMTNNAVYQLGRAES